MGGTPRLRKGRASRTHIGILVGCDGDELGLGEGEGVGVRGGVRILALALLHLRHV